VKEDEVDNRVNERAWGSPAASCCIWLSVSPGAWRWGRRKGKKKIFAFPLVDYITLLSKILQFSKMVTKLFGFLS
jgi:hypothetical protein